MIEARRTQAGTVANRLRVCRQGFDPRLAKNVGNAVRYVNFEALLDLVTLIAWISQKWISDFCQTGREDCHVRLDFMTLLLWISQKMDPWCFVALIL